MATAGLAPIDVNHRLDAYFSGLCESLVASLRTVFLEQLEAEREDMRHSFEAELNRVHAEYKDYIENLQKSGMPTDRGQLPVVVESAPKPRPPPTPQSMPRRDGHTPPLPSRNKGQQDVTVQHHQIQNNQSQDLIAVERLVLPGTRPAMQPGQQVVQAAQQVVQVLHQEAVSQTGAQTHRQAVAVQPVQQVQQVQQVQHVVQHRPPAAQPAPTPPSAQRTPFLPMQAQWPQSSPQQPYFPFHAEPGAGQRQQTETTAPSNSLAAAPPPPPPPLDHVASHGTLPSTAPACNPPTPQHAQSPPPPAPPAPPSTTNGLGGIHEQAMAQAVHQPNYQL
eukprot:gnl/MRDRNA2_/MRDRNA2_92304_c0_seq1.p1 gnl/MRDRNA2_/MRDRNA2_92304_c0~~gnl/MRDRNA2_/MRDRNA2_92304_c0_seq1.p1  ORF type:complete len:334 (-),score=74.61 gnl/MRDRNA2_/MRDRNA2_92304_c0_seq1:84-1085(-)